MATIAQPFGVTLPITRGNQGYFNQSYSALDQIKSNLNLLLRTKKGERRMSPEFGSGLWSILFENSTDDLIPIIEGTIRRDISKWMGYVTVNSVTISGNSDNENYNKISVNVSFTVPSIGISDEQTLTVAMNTNNI